MPSVTGGFGDVNEGGTEGGMESEKGGGGGVFNTPLTPCLIAPTTLL